MLNKVRSLIAETLPNATEKISYGIPTFWDKKNIIHFAAFSRHIGIYPGPPTIKAFADRLKDYPTSKGAVQFEFDKPIPYELIRQMAVYSSKR